MNTFSLYSLGVILALIVLPSLIILGWILYSDRDSKESWLPIVLCIATSIYTVGVSYYLGKFIVEKIIYLCFANDIEFTVFKTLLLALVEESAKLSILYLIVSRVKKFDDIYDGFVYSSIVGLSFATLETILYVSREITISNMIDLSIARLFTSLPLHLTCAIIMGYYVAVARFSKKIGFKIENIVKALFIPGMVHFIYNLSVSLMSLYIKNLVVADIIIIVAIMTLYITGYILLRKTIDLNQKFIKKKA